MIKTNRTNIIHFLGGILIILFLYSCSSDSDDTESLGNELLPKELVGKTLVMKRNDQVYLSATHYKDGAVINSHTVDYEKYPPKYTYTRTSSTTAKYQLEVTKKTYIPYYGTYNYSKFKFDFNLTFSAYNKTGTFSGNEINSYGNATYKTGNFEIK